MKTIYFDCSMGAAGDMLTAALLELHPDREGFLKKVNSLGLPGVETTAETAVSCGITGTHVRVKVDGCEEESLDVHPHDHEHHHEDEHEHCHEHHHEHHHEDEHHHEHGHHHGEDHDHHHEHEHDHEHHHHHHTGMAEVHALVNAMPVSDKVREDIEAVYGLIAQAESRAHGLPIDQVHFHEVGTLDAVADVAAVCLLMEDLAPDQVIATPIHVGSGQVR